MSKRVPGSNDSGAPATISLDGREQIAIVPGDSVATAMIAHGTLMTSRSPKYRRPRGAYCLEGDCGSCLMRIDGRPNQRACMTQARDGMEVQRQNTFEPVNFDPTAMVDRMFPGHFDHHHFMLFPRIANQMMQSFARQLAGFGTLPDAALRPDEVRHRHHAPQVLVIGASTAGRRAFEVLRAAGIDAVLVERHSFSSCRERRSEARDRGSGSPSAEASENSGDGSAQGRSHQGSDARVSPRASSEEEAAHFAPRDNQPRREFYDTGVFAAYPDESLWAASEVHPGVEILHTFAPRAVLLCTGARDPMIPLPNNDKPGIVAARGLQRSLAAAQRKLEGRVIVIGTGSYALACAQALREHVNGEVVELEPSRVRGFSGAPSVTAVLTDTGREPCRLVALADRPAPAFELAAQAGAGVYCDGGGFAVSRDESGYAGPSRCGALWVAGDASGYMGRERAANDGERVAKSILAWFASAPNLASDGGSGLGVAHGPGSGPAHRGTEVTP